MTAQETVSHGVDVEQFAAFAEFAAENPDEVQLGLGATSTYEGTCAHSLAKVGRFELGGEEIARDTREYTIPYGAWREVLEAGGWRGHTDRLEPVEAALSALASCINVGITINALANGVDIEHLETSVHTDFDPGVLFSLRDLSDSDAVFENLEATVEVDGDGVDPDQIDEWARRAPVYTFTSLAQDVNLHIEVPAEVPASD